MALEGELDYVFISFLVNNNDIAVFKKEEKMQMWSAAGKYT